MHTQRFTLVNLAFEDPHQSCLGVLCCTLGSIVCPIRLSDGDHSNDDRGTSRGNGTEPISDGSPDLWVEWHEARLASVVAPPLLPAVAVERQEAPS